MSDTSHLEQLNDKQYEAVTQIQGPVLILAGAGSGKTRVLTRRVAHLLHVGVEPGQILAMTFTNKAAAEMKERVIEMVGEPGEKLWVSTFHSTCCRLLRMDIEGIGWTRRFAIYDDDDQLRMIKGIMKSEGIDTERVVARDLLSRIDHYKNRMMSVETVINDRHTHINDPLIRVWELYEEALQAADALDFNDLIGRTVQLFKTCPEILQKWRSHFRFVLVDEYQDTNRAQYTLLRYLADEHRNLCVVGDDDQSIYGFRGADISNILDFEKDFPEAKVIKLEQNYRSSAHILKLANAVVEQNSDRRAKRLWTAASDGPQVQFHIANDPYDEAKWVGSACQSLNRRGHRWDDIAIIYRTNAVARPYEMMLKRLGISYQLIGGKKFYERREVRDMLAYLRVVVNPSDDAAFLRVVNVPTRGVGAKTQAKLRAKAKKRGQPLMAVARMSTDRKTVGERGVGAFVGIIEKLQALAKDSPVGEIVEQVVRSSGYLAMLEADFQKDGETLTPDAKTRIENLEQLVADAARFTPPPEALTAMEVLTGWLDSTSLAGASDEVPEGGQITLMTVHSSKGLEYPVVFVVQMNEGSFPHSRSLDTGVEEERRLAYVAFTRAKERLIITRSRTAGVRTGGGATTASRFLYGIPLEVCSGDLPGGQPTPDPRKVRYQDNVGKQRLAAFMEKRLERVAPPEDAMLREVTSAEDLHKGAQVFHPKFGVGRLQTLGSAGVHVRFEQGTKLLRYPVNGLHIIVD